MKSSIKRIDSTIRFSAAERYINDADFSEFLRGKYTKEEITAVDMLEVQKKYNIAGFTFGNFVTQVERYFFVFKISKQLEFLAKISGTNDLGKGKLVIGFGADGKRGSLAYFSPPGMYININKGREFSGKNFLQGETSFVHEYAHFLDCVAGLADKAIPFNFACEAWAKYPNQSPFTKFVAVAMRDDDYMDNLKKQHNAAYLTATVEVFARLFESTVNQLVLKDEQYVKYFDTQKYNRDIYLSPEKINSSKAPQLVKSLINYKH